MTEKIHNDGEYKPIGITFEQLLEIEKMQNREQPPRVAPQPSQFNPTVGDKLPVDERVKRKRRHRILGAVSVGLVVVVLGSGYTFNIGGSQHVVQSLFHGHDGAGSPAQADGITIGDILTTGQKGLGPDYCDTPDAVVMVATVSGYMDLVPILSQTTSDNKVVTGPVTPYMTNENAKKLSTDADKAVFKDNIPHNPKDSSQHIEVFDLPMALQFCEDADSDAITEDADGKGLSIHREKLSATFSDPGRVLKTVMNAVHQVKGPGYEKPDVSERQYISIPNRIFLSNGTDTATGKVTDPALNKSYNDLIKGLNTQQESQLITSLIENDFIRQLDSPRGIPSTVTKPDGSSATLQDNMSTALVKKLVGDATIPVSFSGNFDTKAYIPIDPITKTFITTNAKKNLINIDSTQPFHITEANIVFGSIDAFKSTQIPSVIPTPTPTKSPTQ